ncbi:hypothetical protein BJ912DRAFT_953991 [Pholiota molesta]|nr:hypothetical protein BJ912DRAFT_953991 [Pholiota molesta]
MTARSSRSPSSLAVVVVAARSSLSLSSRECVRYVPPESVPPSALTLAAALPAGHADHPERLTRMGIRISWDGATRGEGGRCVEQSRRNRPRVASHERPAVALATCAAAVVSGSCHTAATRTDLRYPVSRPLSPRTSLARHPTSGEPAPSLVPAADIEERRGRGRTAGRHRPRWRARLR